jgi:hypothetical protein
VEALAAEISGLQEGILELVRAEARARSKGLSMTEIAQVARQYLASVKPEVNEVGLHGLLRYVVWLAWHDGWLRRE